MKAVVDCNSFYCSCERLFRPDLWNKPVVVLSNNDGCIIARSDEAKELGIAMAAPYFEYRDLIRRQSVQVFSSNYTLYGELSMRVMDTLRMLMPPGSVEVYSVDEAFLDLEHVPPADLSRFALSLRESVEGLTGIKVSVGIGPGKVLAKLANKLAKKNKAKTRCVMVIDSDEKCESAMQDFPVAELWGIGSRYGVKLREQFGILTAGQLRQMPEEWARKQLGGVNGVRMIRELNGIPSMPLQPPLEIKKMIATTRMFGRPVQNPAALREAVASYTARAAEKLRRQGYAAALLDVFVVTGGAGNYAYQPLTDHRYAILPRATSITNELISQALPLVDQLYKPGVRYRKAGVILGNLVPDQAVQGGLFSPAAAPNQKRLMETLDNINFGIRPDLVKYAATGMARPWSMRQEMRSPRYTTRWEDLCEVR